MMRLHGSSPIHSPFITCQCPPYAHQLKQQRIKQSHQTISSDNLIRCRPELLELLQSESMIHIPIQTHVNQLSFLKPKFDLHVLEQSHEFCKFNPARLIRIVLLEKALDFPIWELLGTECLQFVGCNTTEGNVCDSDGKYNTTNNGGSM